REQVIGKQIATWDGLAQAAGLHRADDRSAPLRDTVARMSGRPADLAAFGDLLGAGRLPEILAALPRNEASRRTGATGRVAREHAATELASALRGWVTGHLVRSGRARWVHSWADFEGELNLPADLKAGLDAAIDSLVAVRPDPAPLRALLPSLAVA